MGLISVLMEQAKKVTLIRKGLWLDWKAGDCGCSTNFRSCIQSNSPFKRFYQSRDVWRGWVDGLFHEYAFQLRFWNTKNYFDLELSHSVIFTSYNLYYRWFIRGLYGSDREDWANPDRNFLTFITYLYELKMACQKY